MHIQMLHFRGIRMHAKVKCMKLACYRDADGLCSAGRGWLLRLIMRPGDHLSSDCKPGSVDEYSEYKTMHSLVTDLT